MSSLMQQQEAKLSEVTEYEVHAVAVLTGNVLHIYASPSSQQDFEFWEQVRSTVSPSSIVKKHNWPRESMDLARMTRKGYLIEEFGRLLPGFIVVYT